MKKTNIFQTTLLLIILCGGGNLIAQTSTKVHEFGIDMKNYHVLADPNSKDFSLAGTVFPNPANPNDNQLHYMWINNTGTVVTSKTFDVANRDERLVAFVRHNATRQVMISLLRGIGNGIDRDRIGLMGLDNAGNPTFNQVIQTNTVFMNADYVNLYPMGALVDGNNLYICGFLSKGITAAPNQPNYNALNLSQPNDKKAFVLRYNLNANVVSACRTYDFTVPSSGSLIDDYDIAMRMKMVNNNGASDLYVTGSCNAEWYDATNMVYNPTEGSMNLVLNRNTLVVSTATKPILEKTPTGEYGLDILPDAASGGYFLIGNKGIININQQPGFDPAPHTITVTYINSSFISTAALLNRAEISLSDYIWCTQTLPSIYGTNRYVLGGYFAHYNGGGSCPTAALQPSLDNINPFLAEILPTWNGSSGIGVGIFSWRTYFSTVGTLRSGQVNSFYQLGGGLSEIAWAPIFAARRTIGSTNNDNIGLYAPWGKIGPLNMKFIITDDDGDDFSCTQGQGPCSYNQTYTNATDCISCNPVTVVNFLPSLQITGASFQIANVFPNNTFDCGLSGIYRTTAVQNISNKIQSLSIYPNPSDGNFSIQFEKEPVSTDVITIEVYDMSGRKVAKAFDGFYAELKMPLSASGLTTGIYLLNVSINRNAVAPLKLSIQ